jgi:hypothetical protein
MKRYSTMFVAALAVLCLVGAAQAAINIPSWQGQPGSTYQEWRFGDETTPVSPDVISNPFGSASATVTVGDFGSGWLNQLPGMGTQTGYWDMGGANGSIVLDIANQPQAAATKEIWVQTVSFVDISQLPIVDVPGATLLDTQDQVFEHVPTGGNWMLTLTKWQIQPSVSSEQIVITSDPMWGAVIDRVIVDTVATPEPISLSLLLVSGVGLLLRRRQA